MDIEEYCFLWDGSEDGWELHYTDHLIWTAKFHFGDSGASQKEIIALRKLIPELGKLSLSESVKMLKRETSYICKTHYGNIESRSLADESKVLGLKCELVSKQIGGYLPVRNGLALVIEDEEISKIACQKMKDAGMPVIAHTHVD